MSSSLAAESAQNATALLMAGRAVDALQLLERVLTDQPDDAVLRRLAGEAALRAGQLQVATAHLEVAVTLEPDHVDGVVNLAAGLLGLGAAARVVALLEPWATRHSSRPLLLNLGRALQDHHRLEAAEEVVRRILATDPTDVEALNNLGTILRDAGRCGEAIACFERALTLAPQLQAARDNLAHSWLAEGDFRRGFAYFEGRRFVDATGLSARLERWDGRPRPGLTLHVVAEQGFGDMLMFCRFGATLAERGIDAILHVHSRLVRLLKRSGGFREVVAYGRAPIGATARWVPLMSLPHLLDLTLATLPPLVPYLQADRQRVHRYAGWLGPKVGLRVGIAWSGNPQSEQDDLRGRSVPLTAFAPLLDVPGLQLISLQRQHGLEQARHVGFAAQLRHPEPELDAGPDGFLDTAALLAALDLVVTCDTSIAHLAGGLGRPVWVALHHTPDWRWLRKQSVSPWYPTMRLVRQTVPGDWSGVFAAIAGQVANAA